MADATYPRLAGMMVPVFSLRHSKDFGIGDTEAVKQAITFCAKQNLGLLQLLPINETGADNSPYNAISSVALDPVYLNLTLDQLPGLLPEMLTETFPESVLSKLKTGPVQYEKVKQLKLEILSQAYVEFEAVDLETGTDLAYEFQAFVEANMGWLPGYTLFRTLLNEYNRNALWHEWIPEHQNLAAAETWLSTAEDKEELVRYRQFTAYVQWICWKQWAHVRAFADEHKVRLIGDIPFGVSRYSADVWSERDLFDLTWSGGAPPEPFFSGDEFLRKWGQNWGLPLYNWNVHRAQDFAWWKQRVKKTGEIFNSFRIDHVLGFFRLYSFPWMPQENNDYVGLTPEQAKERAGGREPQFLPRPDKPEENAEKNCADGEALLKMIQEAAGTTEIVAEDLGTVPEYVPPLLQKMGIPGFAIPQFLVDPETRDFTPKDKMTEISITTWGTHDHAPLLVWYQDLTRRWKGPEGHEPWLELQRLMVFLGEDKENPPTYLTDQLHGAFIRTLLESKARWTVFVISDILGVDWRFNQPGTSTDDNWSQRLDRPLSEYTEDLVYGPKLKLLRDEVIKTQRVP